jgi:hypothetical protein
LPEHSATIRHGVVEVLARKDLGNAAPVLLFFRGMKNISRIFRPGIAVTIKLVVGMMLASAYVLTFAWGYEGRQQARLWREIACTNRLTELQRVTPGLGAGNPSCETLQRVGFSVVARER